MPSSTQGSSENSRPYVILCSAESLDGKIATRLRDSKISSNEDLNQLHLIRSKVDAIMVGINTVLIDDPRLTNRTGSGKNPVRVIVDSQARIPLGSKLIQYANGTNGVSRTIIACAGKASRKKIRALRAAGATVLKFGSRSRVPLRPLLGYLRKEENIKSLMLEGGSELNWTMISQGLVDELRITVSPCIIGGRDSVTLVSGLGVRSVKDSFKLNLSSVTSNKKTGEVLLSYKAMRD